jgi:hypothetical protein
MIRSAATFALLVFATTQGAQDEEKALLKALPNSKLTLLDGIQQVSKAPETPISAKFELEDGKLSLSVYTAGKGLDVDAEHNVLQEYAGSPVTGAWKPEVEVFKDTEHVARSAQQLTLMALAGASLADVVKKAEKAQAGTVYSITPVLRGRKAQFVVLAAQNGHSVELAYDLQTGEPVKVRDADAPRK